MTIEDAASILGQPVDEIKRLQREGKMPDPIPDDYLDPVVKFKLDIVKAHARKVERLRADS